MIELTIPGEPVAKGRPRVCKYGTYTPAKTANYEELVRKLYITQNFARQLEGELRMEVKAYFTIPKSAKKKDTENMANCLIRPIKRPDADNIFKIIADALNGLAYKDDSQIVTAKIEKYYSLQPRVEISISEVGANLGKSEREGI